MERGAFQQALKLQKTEANFLPKIRTRNSRVGRSDKEKMKRKTERENGTKQHGRIPHIEMDKSISGVGGSKM